MKNKVYLSFGSNVGNRVKRIMNSIVYLEKHDLLFKDISSLYLNEPYGYKKQSYFLNAVAFFECESTPEDLLILLKKTEKWSNRKKTFRWGPRTLDIDILLFNDIIINRENLKIPHYDMRNRNFVLIPLLEIYPQAMDPISGKYYKFYLKELQNTDIERVIPGERVMDYLGEII
jgi:2-amino-4-hydroxy-6-hydroxymethyldihydropteridine diphosphokinase